MAVIGNLLVNLSLESRQFLQGIQQATTRTAAATTQISSSMKKVGDLGKGLTAAFAVDWIAGKVQSALDYADAIADLSDQTGIGTKTLQEFRYAAQLSGSSVEDADAAIGKFAKNLGDVKNGNEAMRKEFAALGVTSGDIDTAMRQAADGIQRLGDRQAQAEKTMTLFGKSAGTLTTLMAGGGKAFDELASAAQNLGIVLSEDVLRNAGQVNDKLDSLKMILNAQMASTVAQNATSIASMATALTDLTGSILKFWQSNPEGALAILGALAGMQVGGLFGPAGAAIGAGIGAAAGYYGGTRVRAGSEDMNMDPAFRAQKLREAKKAYGDAKAGVGGTYLADPSGMGMPVYLPPDVKAAAAEVVKQDRFGKAALAMLHAGKSGASTGTGTIPAPKPEKPKGPTAAEIEAKFRDELSRSYVEYLRAREDLETSVVEQAALQREQLSTETDARNRDIMADKNLSAAQKRELIAANDRVEMERADLINRRENEALARERVDVALAANDNERSILTGTQALARTQAERRRIGEKLIDLDYQRERLSLEAVIASKESTGTEKEIARAKLGVLATLQNNDRANLARSTMGPLASYLDAIPRSADEINEALEGVATGGLDRLNDGITDAILGTSSLKAAFADMTSFVIAEIAKIAIRAAIIEPLGAALGGLGGGSGGVGGFFASLFGKRANGGYTPAGAYLVGERGPELVNVGATANVVPNHALRSLGGTRQTVVNSTVYGVNDPYMVRRTAQESIIAAMPLSTKLASDRTLRDVRRPKLR